jgi:hypothetical protein
MAAEIPALLLSARERHARNSQRGAAVVTAKSPGYLRGTKPGCGGLRNSSWLVIVLLLIP